MKVLLFFLLSLLSLSSAFASPEEYLPDRLPRLSTRWHGYRHRQHRRFRRNRLAYARRLRGLSGARAGQLARLKARGIPPTTADLRKNSLKSKPFSVKTMAARPVATRLPVGWRGVVKRSIARTSSGVNAPVENYATLTNLFMSLPEDGEVRVRYGIYNGVRTYGPGDRLDIERRNVRVGCWVYAFRLDSATMQNAGGVQLLVGTSNDSSRAQYMIVEVPGPLLNGLNEELFAGTRSQLATLLSGYTMTSSFRRVQPKQIIVEGSLFFDGIRSLERVSDPSGDLPAPSTVWEIQPVTSIMLAANN